MTCARGRDTRPGCTAAAAGQGSSGVGVAWVADVGIGVGGWGGVAVCDGGGAVAVAVVMCPGLTASDGDRASDPAPVRAVDEQRGAPHTLAAMLRAGRLHAEGRLFGSLLSQY